MSPPTDSTACAMSTALRSSVPLKSRCSRKWLAPSWCSPSSTAPEPTQKPTATDRRSGMASVTTWAPATSLTATASPSARSRRPEGRPDCPLRAVSSGIFESSTPSDLPPAAAMYAVSTRSVTCWSPNPDISARRGRERGTGPKTGAPHHTIAERRSADGLAPAAATTATTAPAAVATAVPVATAALAAAFLGTELAELGAGLLVPLGLERRDLRLVSTTVTAVATVTPVAALGTLTPATAVAVVRATVAVTLGRVAREREGELARVVDVVDADRDLVTEVEHVLHPVDALAAPDLGDVEQTVTAGKDVDERTELRDVHDAPGVVGAELGRRRVEDELDPAPGLVDLAGVLRPDAHRADDAVVGHRDVGTGLLLDRVDDLALGPDDLADLVDRDLEADDLRGRGTHVLTRRGDGAVHDLEDLEAGFLRLLQRGGEDVGREAVDLRVELERGDELRGTGDLEVHVAERVLRPEDVGEGRVLALGVDQTHRDARDRRLDRHARVHQRQRRAADRAHRGGAVRRQHVAHDAQRVGPLLLRRHHRHERPLGERAVTDLATLRRADPARLARRERSEVVVVHVALAVFQAERVDDLLHPEHAERGDREDLGLAPLEETGAVHRVDDADLGRERPDVGDATTVDAHTVVDDAGPHDLLLQRAERGAHFLGATGEGARRVVGADEAREQRGLDLVEAVVAVGLVGGGHRLRRGGAGLTGDRVEDVVGVVDVRRVLDRLDRTVGGDDRRPQLELEVDGSGDPLLGGLEPVGDGFLGDLRRALLVELPRGLGATGLHHHDRDLTGVGPAPGDDELERRLVALLVRRVRDPGTVEVREAHGADRAVERDARDHQRRGGTVDRDDVVRIRLVRTEDGRDDLHLVAEVGREARPQRAVGQAAGQDRRLAGTAFTPEERAGDLSRGVHALLDVDRQREEVDAVARLRRGDGAQHHRVADLHHDGAGGEAGELARLDGHFESGRVDLTGNLNRVTHGCAPLTLRRLATEFLGEGRFPVVIARRALG